jgi:PKD repeat protein
MENTKKTTPQKKLSLFLGLLLGLFAWSNSSAQTYDSCVKADFDITVSDKTVKLESKTKGPVVVYNWNLGDGNGARTKDVKHTYANYGIYKVSLTVFGFDTSTKKRCKFEVVKRVIVKDPCTDFKADFVLSQDSNLVKVAGRSNSKNTTYAFLFGDGTKTKGQFARHKYSKPGTYVICMIAKDTVLDCVKRVCKTIHVPDACDYLKADFVIDRDELTVKLRGKANSNNAVYGYVIDDTIVKRGQFVKHTFTKRGAHTICLIAKDTVKNCKVKVCKRIVIPPKCAYLKADFANRQNDEKFQFSARSNAKKPIYIWTFGDSTRGKGQTVKHEYKKPGVYEVCLIVVDSATKCRVKICKKVVVKKPCDIKGDFAFRMAGKSAKFKARSNSNTARYIWTFGDGTSATGKEAKHRYKKPGIYTVCLTILSGKDCGITICKRVKIKKPKGKSPLQQQVLLLEDGVDQEDQPDNNPTNGPEVQPLELKLSPNPTQTESLLEINRDDVQSIAVYAFDGTLVKKLEKQHLNSQVNLSDLPRGNYFIRAVDLDGNVETTKFIKE